MIPIEVRGRSFKGLIAYLSSPPPQRPKQDKSLRRMVFTGNMEEFNPRSPQEVAAIMARHAREDVRRGLMEAANVRGRARTLDMKAPPVFHLILSFPPGMPLHPHPVKQAVRQALQALEGNNGRSLADHQYAAFLHTDTDNPHLHVVVNLIDHNTGRLAHPYRSQQKLQAWANRWCLAHGYDVCPARQEKYNRIENNKRHAHATGQKYRDHKGYINLNSPPLHLHKAGIECSPDQRSAADAAAIREICTKGYSQRKRERDSLYQWKKAQVDMIRHKYDSRIKTARKLKTPALPFSIDARQTAQRKKFFRRENRLTGRLLNSVHIAWLETAADKGHGFAAVFHHYLCHPAARRSHLFRRQYAERARAPRVMKLLRKKAEALHVMQLRYDQRKKEMDEDHKLQRDGERAFWEALNQTRTNTKLRRQNKTLTKAVEKHSHYSLSQPIESENCATGVNSHPYSIQFKNNQKM